MSNRPRVAMEVTVRWWTSDPVERVVEAFRALDATDFPDPATWVSEAIHVGARAIDPTIIRDAQVNFELLTEGPESWASLYEAKESSTAE